jgi:hypothetical protein
MTDMRYGLTAQERLELKLATQDIAVKLYGWDEPNTEFHINSIIDPLIVSISEKLQEAFNEGFKKGREEKIDGNDLIGIVADLVCDRMQDRKGQAGAYK